MFNPKAVICARPIRARDLFLRNHTIAGLRTLADLLESNPAMPVQSHTATYSVHAVNVDDPAGVALVDHVAALLKVPVTDDREQGGHYTATKHFGAITYQAVHVSTRYQDEARARDSYRGNITVNTGQDGDDVTRRAA